jgi:HD superfamily phosphohydrolase
MALNEIAEILLAAGCGESETEMIVSSIQKRDSQKTEKLIAKCRRKQLDRLHESQACIDRLDYLSYQLRKA